MQMITRVRTISFNKDCLIHIHEIGSTYISSGYWLEGLILLKKTHSLGVDLRQTDLI